ncbi:MAG: metallophosphoesterase [Candidatus Aenigmatarchaeota archaeon]
MKFILNEPALYLSDVNSLVIGDLHIGLEYELSRKGINLPKQTNMMLEKIQSLIKKTNADNLIILGDIKHQVPGISYTEENDIKHFFETLQRKVKISVCLGNHDTFLKKILSSRKIKLYSSRGFKIKDYGFFHGHAWPRKDLFKCKYLISSHIHPTILFLGKFGHRITEPVWIKFKLDTKKIEKKYDIKNKGLEMIIVPAFNRLLSGSNINVSKIKEDLDPLLSDLVIKEETEFYLLDGTYLGRLKDIG